MPIPSRVSGHRRRKSSGAYPVLAALLTLALILAVAVFALARRSGEPQAKQAVQKEESTTVSSYILLLVADKPKTTLTRAVLLGVDEKGGSLNAVEIPAGAFLDVPGRGYEKLSEAYAEGSEYVVEAVKKLSGLREVLGYLELPADEFDESVSGGAPERLFDSASRSDISSGDRSRIAGRLERLPDARFTVRTLPGRSFEIGSQSYFAVDKKAMAREIEAFWGVRPSVRVKEEQRVIILNGNGVPGVGAKASELLLDGGFRIVDVKNAENFGYRETEIHAFGDEARSGAQDALRLLGTGKVTVKAADQDITDLVIILGADFKP